MKKLLIIISLFASYTAYGQNVPKSGNKINFKPYGIQVPTSSSDDTPLARLELFNTGVSLIKPTALPIASASLLGAIRVGTGLSIDGSGILSATGGGGGLPTLTTGSIPFSDGTTLAQDNSNFFWNNTNKRLGIGTNTPQTPLQVMHTPSSYVGAQLVGNSPSTNLLDDYPALAIINTNTTTNNYAGIDFYDSASPASQWASASVKTIWTTHGTSNATSRADLAFVTNGADGFNTRLRITSAGLLNVPGLTASSMLKTDASKNIAVAVSNTDYLPVASPAMTGTPVAPTPGTNINTTQIPTTAWTNTYYAAKASPALTGTPTSTTATAKTNTTQIATTAFVSKQFTATGSGTGAATTITVAHGITGVTSANSVIVFPNNAAAAGISYATMDATNVSIVYTVAPASGTNNLSYSISIK